jgi:hypothetical protein
MRWGEVKEPFFTPDAPRAAEMYLQMEPLPLVPATWTAAQDWAIGSHSLMARWKAAGVCIRTADLSQRGTRAEGESSQLFWISRLGHKGRIVDGVRPNPDYLLQTTSPPFRPLFLRYCRPPRLSLPPCCSSVSRPPLLSLLHHLPSTIATIFTPSPSCPRIQSPLLISPSCRYYGSSVSLSTRAARRKRDPHLHIRTHLHNTCASSRASVAHPSSHHRIVPPKSRIALAVLAIARSGGSLSAHRMFCCRRPPSASRPPQPQTKATLSPQPRSILPCTRMHPIHSLFPAPRSPLPNPETLIL